MKKLFSTKYSASAFNLAMLLLRVFTGGLMIPHGYDKLIHFAEYKKDFYSFLGTGGAVSLGLTIFAEFFCAIFIVCGLFTRLATFPLTVAMSIALFKAHKGEIFGDGEHATLFLGGYLVILLLGPGKVSLDAAVGK